MKQTTKYIGMVAIVAMFALATVPGSINEAEAGIHIQKKVVLPEPDPDVDLTLKQMFDTKLSTVSSTTTTDRLVLNTSDAVTYYVTYLINNSGETDVKNVVISVQSDTEIVNAELVGKLDARNSVITVYVNAIDPATIKAKIVGYEI